MDSTVTVIQFTAYCLLQLIWHGKRVCQDFFMSGCDAFFSWNFLHLVFNTGGTDRVWSNSYFKHIQLLIFFALLCFLVVMYVDIIFCSVFISIEFLPLFLLFFHQFSLITRQWTFTPLHCLSIPISVVSRPLQCQISLGPLS